LPQWRRTVGSVWVHQSDVELGLGACVLPSAVTGVQSSFRGGRDDAVARGHLDPALAYIAWVETEAGIDRSFTFCGDDPWVYEVIPIGDLLPDPDPTKLPGWQACRAARIVRVISRPSG
jgi:hypothetical protein